jgi:hypothetical protein
MFFHASVPARLDALGELLAEGGERPAEGLLSRPLRRSLPTVTVTQAPGGGERLANALRALPRPTRSPMSTGY